MNKTYKVKDLDTGIIHAWTFDQVLAEINRDHSDEWLEYNKTDWKEGWRNWVEGDYYSMIEPQI